MIKLIHSECLAAMREMPDNSVHAIVTDPPYGLAFMGKKWDYDVPSVAIWAECLRILKPGGHLLAFAGTRTQHRMAVNIEDAGFEIRDMIAWVYGSGFPKSHDVSKAIDRQAGAERKRVPYKGGIASGSANYGGVGKIHIGTKVGFDAITHNAKKWEGWGTALKPALEPITVARKPFKGTVAQNVLKHGTGGLNIDATRIPTNENLNGGAYAKNPTKREQMWGEEAGNSWKRGGAGEYKQPQGRFPANLIHDGSEEVVRLFPVTGKSTSRPRNNKATIGGKGKYNGGVAMTTGGHDDNGGSAARFFYCAKASKRDRDEGLDGFEEKQTVGGGGGIGNYKDDVNSASGKFGSEKAPSRNHHATVKPTDLMRYLCRLITPPNGIILDPFMGSGSTGKAAKIEGFGFIGIEMDAEYVEIARARIEHAKFEPKQTRLFT